MKGVIGSPVKYAGDVEYGPNGEYKAEDNIPGSRTGFKPYLRPSLLKATKDIDKKIVKILGRSKL